MDAQIPSVDSPSPVDEPLLRLGEGLVRIKVVVQPEEVQVKRVGRASCIEPEIKLCVESDSPETLSVTILAYLKVLGKDDKHKFILLRRSEEIVLSKNHRREIIPMKLRFLKNIKVQMLKRNLGVSRPEASVVFHAVTALNEVTASTSTTHFAIISDPRYLDEVKKRRACERLDEEYVPSSTTTTSSSSSSSSTVPAVHSHPSLDNESSDEAYVPPRSKPSPKRRRTFKIEDITESPPHVPEVPTWSPRRTFSTFQALKDTADEELLANNAADEDEMRLIELVESLKHKGCNFRILPPGAHA